jgi:hypothetical protein
MNKESDFRYVIAFHKDGDRMGISTTLDREVEFLSGCASILSSLIEFGAFDGDWDFQLELWLPQISHVAFEISCVDCRPLFTLGVNYYYMGDIDFLDHAPIAWMDKKGNVIFKDLMLWDGVNGEPGPGMIKGKQE